MKIVADKDIPYLKGVAEHFGEVTYLAGNEFTKESIKDADTLIVRTVTYFGKDILEGSNVKLICSATIGFDHIDIDYCQQNNIRWYNAPGCNSGSVMQYIVSSLIVISEKKGFNLKDRTIGIIGVGNVGKKVAKACQLLGMKVLLNDPIREINEKSEEFVDIEIIKREADIITFHVPLNKSGLYKTHHIANDIFFQTLGKHPIIINSSRGGIIDTEAIKKAIKQDKISGAVIDCWENEPNIDLEYMSLVDIATPHIAGYSADGKANATRMALEHIASFGDKDRSSISEITPKTVKQQEIDMDETIQNIYKAILQTYNPTEDHKRLTDQSSAFSALRSNYPVRREYGAYTVINANQENESLLKNMGFNIK